MRVQWERLSRAMNGGDEVRNQDKSVRVHSRPAAAVAASARSEAAQQLGAELAAAAAGPGTGLRRKPSVEERRALMDAQRARDAASAAAASAAVTAKATAPVKVKPTAADKAALLNAQRERAPSMADDDAEQPDAVASLMTSFGESQLAKQLQSIGAAAGAAEDLADDGGEDKSGSGGDDVFYDDESVTIDEDEV
jgi:hypothetical protein